MKVTAKVLMVVFVMLVGLASVQAGWVDSFDSYSVGALPTTNWELEQTGSSQQSVATGGYTGNAIQTWNAAAQYRAAGVGAYQITARLRGTTDSWDTAQVGFCAANADDAGFDLHENSVLLQMNNGSISFVKYDAAGTKTYFDTKPGLYADTTWYDVRLTVDGLNVLAEYRVSDVGGTWWTVTSGTADAGFAPNYVGVYGNRAAQTSIDDVAVVPEPATVALLGFSGLLLRRRKA